jgi:hypothetical protein
MSAEMQEFAARNDDMDLPNEVVLPFSSNFLTGNLIELSPDWQANSLNRRIQKPGSDK